MPQRLGIAELNDNSEKSQRATQMHSIINIFVISQSRNSNWLLEAAPGPAGSYGEDGENPGIWALTRSQGSDQSV